MLAENRDRSFTQSAAPQGFLDVGGDFVGAPAGRGEIQNFRVDRHG
jgi:hypothetical protein